VLENTFIPHKEMSMSVIYYLRPLTHSLGNVFCFSFIPFCLLSKILTRQCW